MCRQAAMLPNIEERITYHHFWILKQSHLKTQEKRNTTVKSTTANVVFPQ